MGAKGFWVLWSSLHFVVPLKKDPTPSIRSLDKQKSKRPGPLPGLESGITRGKWRRDGLRGLQREPAWLKHPQGVLNPDNAT